MIIITVVIKMYLTRFKDLKKCHCGSSNQGEGASIPYTITPVVVPRSKMKITLTTGTFGTNCKLLGGLKSKYENHTQYI